MSNPDACAERRLPYILLRLQASISIEIDAVDLCFGIALRQHQRDQSRSRPDIEDPHPVVHLSPCSEQGAVGADFHGATVVPYGKLFKTEIRIGHRQGIIIKTPQR